jgi:hypothetical protein
MEDVPDFSDGYTEAWFMPNAKYLDGYEPVSVLHFAGSARNCEWVHLNRTKRHRAL